MRLKRLVYIFGLCFFVWYQGASWCGNLVTIETQKAYLTLKLIEKFILLEKHLRSHINRHNSRYKILVLAPQSYTAFQDQQLVNKTVIEFLKKRKIFHVTIVKTTSEAIKAIHNGHFDILYIAGLVSDLDDLIKLSYQKKILTVSHLTELVYKGVAISLDLDRVEACIVANKETWKRLNLSIPQKLLQKICFVP